MPASRSPSQPARPAARRRSLLPLVHIGVAAALVVIVVALPASAITHFLPRSIRAEDFSGSIWHGSAEKISFNGRDAGALEWRLHPGALLRLAVAADLHWVKVGFVVDAALEVDRSGFTARAGKGGGPIQDLQDLGVAPGWRGMADVHFSELKGDFVKPSAAVANIQVSNVTSAQIADGADLGGYELRLEEGAVGSDGTVTAHLADTGGPLEMKTLIHFSPLERTALLSGTLKERADVSAALRSELDGLSQLRGRDPQGRIPVDLEFRF
jgi:hypothetical protein